MTEIIKEAITRSHNYHEYRKIISELLNAGKATGMEQSADLTHYTLLNETRMNRLEKTISADATSIAKLAGLKRNYTWLVISEGWCGDSAQIVPVIEKLASAAKNIDLKFVFRDENESLMELFLTNGAKSIPKLLVLDENLKVLADWGPRPYDATELIKKHKAAKGHIDDEAKTELQLWYLHDKGLAIQNELVQLMMTADSE